MAASIRVEVTQQHLDDAKATALPDELWCQPVEEALAGLTGQKVSIDYDGGGQFIATIGQDEWTLVIDLPEAANDFLHYRDEGGTESEPIAFEIDIPVWITDLVRIGS